VIEAIAILTGVLAVGFVALHRQLNRIHELVNSNLTKAQTDLAMADARIRVLEDHIAHEPDTK
jgi:hypothetical protein